MSSHPMPGVRLSVLVADSDPDAAGSCAEMLQLKGFDATPVFSGREALAIDPADAAVIDLRLAGVDGYAVAGQLRGRAASWWPLLIAVTGSSDDLDHGRLAAAGFDMLLVKPVGPEVIATYLREFADQIRVVQERLTPPTGSVGHGTSPVPSPMYVSLHSPKESEMRG